MSECSGKCIVCKLVRCCPAGHFDDNFKQISLETAEKLLKSTWHSDLNRPLYRDELLLIESLIHRIREVKRTQYRGGEMDQGFIRYYHMTARNTGERITVCLLIQDGKILARGVAACSLKDQFVKKLGRRQALTRVHQAVGRATQAKVRGYPIVSAPRALDWCPFAFLWYINPFPADPLEAKILQRVIEQTTGG